MAGDVLTSLLALFPEPQRALAEPMLREEVLPVELSGLSVHPRPERFEALVSSQLGDELRLAAPPDRLSVLRRQVERSRLRGQRSLALTLGVARYLLAHPEAISQAGHWLSPAVQSWMGQGRDAVLLEAVEQLNTLERWEERVAHAYPTLHAEHHADWQQARLSLQSCISGSFQTTGGPLSDFVRAVGGESRALHLGE